MCRELGREVRLVQTAEGWIWVCMGLVRFVQTAEGWIWVCMGLGRLVRGGSRYAGK